MKRFLVVLLVLAGCSYYPSKNTIGDHVDQMFQDSHTAGVDKLLQHDVDSAYYYAGKMAAYLEMESFINNKPLEK